jgi:hypothetical protein
MVANRSRLAAVVFSMLFSAALAVAAFIVGRVTEAAAVVALALLMTIAALHQGLMLTMERRDSAPFSNDRYFWCFAAGAMLYAAGAGVALYHAASSVALPPLIEHSFVIYPLLGFAVLCLGGATYVGIDALSDAPRELSLLDKLQTAGQPVIAMTAVEIMAGLAGVGAALLGVYAADRLGFVNADAAAAVGIALIMSAVAAVQALTLRSLMGGHEVSREIKRAVTRTLALEAERSGAIRRIDDVIVRQVGRGQMQVAVRLAFKDGVDAAHIPAVFDKLVARVRSEHQTVHDVVLAMAPMPVEPAPPVTLDVNADAKR